MTFVEATKMVLGLISFQLMAGIFTVSQWPTSKSDEFIGGNLLTTSHLMMLHLLSDQYDEDAWHSIPTSFQNLGRSRNRCWPWTEDHSLPYRRTGADAPVWGKSWCSLLMNV
jgi:hypothetical protein